MGVFQGQFCILVGMKDGVKREMECEVVGLAGRGYNGVEKRRDYKAVDRAGEGCVRLQAELGCG